MIFASKHVINGNSSSRRDDIIQIVYNLIYLLNPVDCWMFTFFDLEDPLSKMAEFKRAATPEIICAGERCKCIIDLCQEAYSYDFDAEPRYGVLKFILENELLKLNVVPDNMFSWLQVNRSFIGRICTVADQEQEEEEKDGESMGEISE